MDYSDIGLNNRLQPTNSLAASPRRFRSAYDTSVNQAFPLGRLNYSHLTPDSRTYTAVVSLSRTQGTFDDLQEALDYVRRQGGGRILVLQGTYTISKNLTIYADTSIEGEAANDCVIDFNGSTNNLSTATSATDIRIYNLTFQNCQNTTTGTIYLDNVRRVKIESCVFSGNKNGSNAGYDIYASVPSQITIRNCRTTSGATFYFADNTGAGINEVSFNEINDCAQYAIEGGTTGAGGGETRFENNIFINCQKSWFFGNFDRSVLMGNNTSGGTALTQVGLDLNNSDTIRVIGNHFTADTGTQGAIDLDGCDNCLFSSNVIQGRKEGVPVIQIGTSTQNTFVGNRISQNSAGGTTIDGVKVINGDSNIIVGNFIEGGRVGGTSYAVNITSTESSNNVIVGNFLVALSGDINDGGTLTTSGNNN